MLLSNPKTDSRRSHTLHAVDRGDNLGSPSQASPEIALGAVPYLLAPPATILTDNDLVRRDSSCARMLQRTPIRYAGTYLCRVSGIGIVGHDFNPHAAHLCRRL